MKNRQIVVNTKQYTMPKIGTEAYFKYLDTREHIAKTTGMYTRQDFYDMADAIVELYGHQFTREDVLNEEYGLSPSAIMQEFVLVEAVVMGSVDKAVEETKENFTAGA